VRYSIDAAIGLGGYTAVTFDATARFVFVRGVAVLGGVAPSTRVEVTSVSGILSMVRRSLLHTVGVNVNFRLSFEESTQVTSTACG